jgi:soluble lytic murein transglycosylase-like protein
VSAAAVAGRMDEIQQLLAAVRTGQLPGAAVNPAGSTGGASFADTLAATTTSAALGTTSALAPATAGDATAYDALIDAAAQRNGVDPALLKGLIRAESNFDPNAGSPAGAQGLTQLMPGTASALGVSDVHDPAQSIEGGARYLRQQLDAFGGDETRALAAYNAGPGAVTRYGGVPPYAETQSYVQRVLGYAAGYRTATPISTTPTVT